jgi:hypothetical protein
MKRNAEIGLFAKPSFEKKGVIENDRQEHIFFENVASGYGF